METHSIAGGWLGTYYYDSYSEPTRFEASFSAMGRDWRFGGRILDDGPLGDANAINGAQTGQKVSFVKVYVRPPGGHITVPVYYEGQLSEDGKTMSGTWRLSLSTTGTWEARRLWFEEAEEAMQPESERLLVGAIR
jgi:hypothetical protein